MPFLETHEPTDAGAAEALWYIATSNPDQTRRILDHPSLRSGITDAQTPIVTLTYGEYLFGADPTRLLSDQEIESHIHPAELPMAGNILITIVSRTVPSQRQPQPPGLRATWPGSKPTWTRKSAPTTW